MPYGQALLLWTLFNLACLAVATILLCRLLAPPGTSLKATGVTWRAWGLVPLYFKQVASVPPLVVLAHRIVWSVVCLSILVTILYTVALVVRTIVRRRRSGVVA